MEETKSSPFFSKEGSVTPIRNLKGKHYRNRIERNNLVLDVIRIHSPISKYQIAKMSGLSYSTIKQIVKEFEFCGLIYVKVATGDNGLPVKLVSLVKQEDEESE